MLTRLYIRNLAVIDEVEVEARTGFSALTGETGAGKSILVDALALALGARADSGALRVGAERAEVAALFDIGLLDTVREWLANRDIDCAGECQLRRIVTADGRSRGYVNGQPVPMEMLRELGSQLVEICGQHAHQSLVDRATQRDLLDGHGGHRAACNAVAQAHGAWSAAERDRQELQQALVDRQARKDLLAFQAAELHALGLREGEYADLEQERRVLASAGRIADAIGLALGRLYDAEDGSAHDLIGQASRELAGVADVDPALAPAVEALAQAGIHVADAASQLRRRLDALDMDPARRDAVESRLAAIIEAARRHRCDPVALGQRLADIEAELATIEGSDSRLAQLTDACRELYAGFRTACDELTRARQRAAATLADTVTANLHELGMPEARFEVAVEVAPRAGPTGADTIEFRVATNPGQSPGPIARVASGGELSRLSLAVQVVAMAAHGAPTLIFDEVDAGIGGGVAEVVGRSLRRLSSGRQVLCVTHLAQVASQADHHLAVAKTAAAKDSRTTVRELGPADRVEEIARMIGGVTITERTRAHAREMLAPTPRSRRNRSSAVRS